MRNGLGSTFQHKETILDFSTKFAQKEFFHSQTEKVSIKLVNVSKFILNKNKTIILRIFGPKLR